MPKEQTPTPHINAEYGKIAKTVVMPGDPNRAKLIAEKFMDNVEIVNKVRGTYTYTGDYKGKKLSVMSSGMGHPSMGIYSHELYNCYDVDNIVRVGTAGAYSEKLNINDIVVAMGTCMISSFTNQFELPGTFSPIANWDLCKIAAKCLDKKDIHYEVGNVLSSEIFYEPSSWFKKWADLDVLACEMEAGALYCNAAKTGKRAIAIATISDHFIKKDQKMTAEERETSLMTMLETGMDIAYNAADLKSL